MTLAVWLTHSTVTAWRFQPRHEARLQAALPQATLLICHSRDAFLEALPRATVALVWSFRQEWFYLAPSLQILATPAAGHDYFSVLPPEGMALWYGSFHGTIMAETILGMMLAAHRGVLTAAQWMSSHNDDTSDIPSFWPREELEPLQRPLRGSHLTILGFGHIGEAVGRLAKLLGIHISGIRRTRLDAPPDYFEPTDQLLPPDALDELLPLTDTLVCALPGGVGTDNLIGESQLQRLPRHAVLINVGRGNVIDEAALVRTLDSGHLSAACLDVFHSEPLPPDAPLRHAPRCFLMPHASAVAPDYLDLYLDELIPKLQSLPAVAATAGSRSS